MFHPYHPLMHSPTQPCTGYPYLRFFTWILYLDPASLASLLWIVTWFLDGPIPFLLLLLSLTCAYLVLLWIATRTVYKDLPVVDTPHSEPRTSYLDLTLRVP